MRVFIELAYDGTNYHGWQRQPEGMTVQQAIEEALERLLCTADTDTNTDRVYWQISYRVQYIISDIIKILSLCLFYQY